MAKAKRAKAPEAEQQTLDLGETDKKWVDDGKDEDEEKAVDEDEDEDDEEDEEDEDEEKSELTEDDLEKSIEMLEDLVLNSSEPDRKAQLLEKAQRSTLTKSENDELYALNGGSEVEPRMADGLAKSVAEDETCADAFDVSNFLEHFSETIVKSVGGFVDTVEAGNKRQHEFNVVMAKSLALQAKLLKSLIAKSTEVEQQPARAPKSMGVGVLSKSFGEAGISSDQLSSSQIADSLGTMFEQAHKSGNEEAANRWLVAGTKFEASGRQISKDDLAAVQEFRRSKGAA